MKTSCSHIVQNWLGHPRTILASFSVLMLVISLGTLYSHPPYMLFPNLSVVTALAGAIACLWALIRPSMWSLALAGACIAGAVAARGFGISLTLIFDEWTRERSVTLLIGDAAWMVLLTMLPPVWSKHLIPWGVAKVVVKDP